MKLEGGKNQHEKEAVLEQTKEDEAEDRRVEGGREGRLEGGGRNVEAGVDDAA